MYKYILVPFLDSSQYADSGLVCPQCGSETVLPCWFYDGRVCLAVCWTF